MAKPRQRSVTVDGNPEFPARSPSLLDVFTNPIKKIVSYVRFIYTISSGARFCLHQQFVCDVFFFVGGLKGLGNSALAFFVFV